MTFLSNMKFVDQQGREIEIPKKDVMIMCHGGIGDVLCTEPAIRFFVEKFRDSKHIGKVALITDYPQFFKHIEIDEYFSVAQQNRRELDYKSWKFLNAYRSNQNDMHDHFARYIYHGTTHPVEYMFLGLNRRNAPQGYRHIEVADYDFPELKQYTTTDHVFIHPGSNWASKTFPKLWWDKVISGLVESGKTPVIIGTKRSTVDVNTEGCKDLRDETLIEETLYLLKNAKVVLTNDSFPLHAASIGKAFIGFIETMKEADCVMHHRKTVEGKIEFAYRTKNFSKDSIINMMGEWYDLDLPLPCEAQFMPEGWMDHILPYPTELVEWSKEVVKDSEF